jgi:hypothetical protein
LTPRVGTATRFGRLATAVLRAAAFFTGFDLEAAILRGFTTCFLTGFDLFDLLVTRATNFWAFFAGALADAMRLPSGFGRADFGLTLLLFAVAFGAGRREAERLIPFVTGLLI